MGFNALNRKKLNLNYTPNDIQPPRWSLRLLKSFLKKDYLEEIEGDMEEVFEENLEKHSVKKARRLYNREVIKLLRPNLIRAIGGNHQLNYIGMLQHNLLITLRGFARHKTSFLINLIGLSTGLAASLLIFLWVSDERSVDTFHEKSDQLYWVMNNFQMNDDIITWDYTSGKIASTFIEEFPEVEDAVRMGNHFFRPLGIVTAKDKNLEIEGRFASPNLFEVMSYNLLVGNPETVIESKESVVISEDLAIRLFDSVEGALNQTLEWENRFFDKGLTITGVFQSPPENATDQFDAVISYDLLVDRDEWADHWKGGYARTFLTLKKGTDIAAFNQKIENFLDDKLENDRSNLFVTPYADQYLHGKYESGLRAGGRIENVRLFTLISLLILAIACINFMNMSTAQASLKMKEIGVKKTIGANRSSLIWQFLSEAVLLSFLATVLAVIVVNLTLPQFNIIADKQIALNLSELLPALFGIVFITGLVAGSYPAFYLSAFKPIAVLKGKMTNIKGDEFVRKGLVITQFTLSIVFIVGVIVINKQIEFTQSKDLGYNREQVITFESKGLTEESFPPFIGALKEIPGVINASNMAGTFLWGNDNGSGFWMEENPEVRMHIFKSPKIGFNVIETLGLEIVAGRSYNQDFADNEHHILLTESAVALFGLTDPVGTTMKYADDETRQIIGVVKDFQYGSIHQKIEPLIFRFRDWGRNCIVKIQPGTEITTLERIDALYSEFHPKYDFEATYLDDEYQALYNSENQVASISNYMAGIAIIISCLGLFGLAAFTAQRRTKEIGIRKILGASQMTVIRLLTSSFTKTILLAILVSLPLGYFLADNWLQNFAYAIELKWWFFAIAGTSALIIAWFTVGLQTLKASMINPAQCLRNE